MCCCRFKFIRDGDEQMALLPDRSILPLSNRVIVQQEFRLIFNANQELIRRPNFRADISPAHIVCTLYFPCITVSKISTVSDMVLPDIHFPTYPSCTILFDTVFYLHYSTIRMIFFNILRPTRGTEQYSSYKTNNMCAHAVNSGLLHQITKYNVNYKRDISHYSNTDYFPSIFFLTYSTYQDLHRPSKFRVDVFLRDISSWRIYSCIFHVKVFTR